MGGKKKPYNPAADAGYVAPPVTQDITKAREDTYKVDPGVAAAFGQARNEIKESFDNPFGGYATDALRQSEERTRLGGLGQQQAVALQSASNDAHAANINKDLQLAALTKPQLVQNPRAGQPSGWATLGAGVAQGAGTVLA